MKRLMMVWGSVLASAALAATPTALLDGARREGALVVYSTTDAEQVRPLLDDFRRRYPFLRVAYHDLSSAEIDRRVRAEAAGHGGADVAWSSAMDLQVRLVNEGYAQAYASRERDALPSWAQWRDEVYGTTFEPVVFAWNRRRLPDARVPSTHEALRRQLSGGGAEWKVAGYDVERSGVGYLLLSQDAVHNPEFWDLARQLQPATRAVDTSSRAVVERLLRGEASVAYNVIGPYAEELARRHPELGWRIPEDYALVLSRLTLITRHAAHPNAARLWTDYLLSEDGQRVLAEGVALPPLRRGLARRLGKVELDALAESLRPIQVGTGLLVYLDRAKKERFLRRWRELAARRAD